MNVCWFAVLCSLCVIHSEALNDDDTYDVVIIGAGITGVTLGRELSENTDKFLILEAEDRVGGRMKNAQVTLSTGETMNVNIGANWIHGGVGNPLRAVAEQYGLQVSSDDYDNILTLDYGEYIGSVDDYMRWYEFEDVFASVEYLAELYDGWIDDYSDSEEPDLTDDEKLELYGLSIKDQLDALGWNYTRPTDVLLEWAEVDFEFGAEAHELSLLMQLPELTYSKAWGGGNNDSFVTDPRGYQYLAEAIAADYFDLDANGDIDDARLQLSTTVRRIDQTNDDYVIVTTTDGAEVRARKVVVTVSLGCLQKDTIEFDPALSTAKQTAITKSIVSDDYGMAEYFEVYFEFSELPTNGTEYYYYNGHHKSYSEAMTNKEVFPLFINLDLPDRFPGTKLMLSHVSGEFAKEAESMSDEEIVAIAREALNGMFTKAVMDDITFEVRAKSNWLNNPNFHGTWAAFPPGYTWDIWEDLVAPEGNVYFYGAYTNAEIFGFVHGGYAEGLVGAQTIWDDLEAEQGDDSVDNSSTEMSLLMMVILMLVAYLR